jgi:formate dehydrogenase subunit beta
MKVDAIFKADRDILGAARDLLRRLLKEGIVEYLLVPQEISHGRSLVQTLVKDPEHLEKANPFSPVMPMNSASIVGQLTADKPEKKLAAVLKPCEIRAFVELVKLGQANRENLLIIGTDCLGTYEVDEYAGLIDEMEGPEKEKGAKVLDEMRKNLSRPEAESVPICLRPACRICTFFVPALEDINLSVFGSGSELIVSLESDLAEKLSLQGTEMPGRREAVDALTKARTAVREKVFAEFREKMKTANDLADALSTCIRCYACSSACPICYCRVCFFRTETFEPESDRYFRWAGQEGVLRMPTEILLYHLTRLNHVAASCVDCGMCESACSRKIPLTTIFEAVGDGVKKALNYVPGRDLKEAIPITTFKETGT